jgi:transposase-like protein
MRLLVSGATSALRRHHHPDHLGILVVPGAGNSISRTVATGLPWAADNAAFSGFDAGLFCTLLGRIAGRPGCVFVACSDKVGDAKATLQLFARWQPILKQVGLPVAFVGQDGAEHMPVPWEDFQALFLGGSTDWKLGPGAAVLAAEAKRRGLWLHMGRCNTRGRFRHAHALGCDSVDGSGFSKWPDQRIPAAIRWLADLEGKSPPEKHGPSAMRFFRGSLTGLLTGPGWSIEKVGQRNGEYVEPQACPYCRRTSPGPTWFHRHGERVTRIRDVPRHGRPVSVVTARFRYLCQACGRTFVLPLPGVSPSGTMSEALIAHILLRGNEVPNTQIAREVGMDEKTVRAVRAVRNLYKGISWEADSAAVIRRLS